MGEYLKTLATASYLTLLVACGGSGGGSPIMTGPTPTTQNAVARGSIVNKLNGSVPCSGGLVNFAGATGGIMGDGSFEVNDIKASVPNGTTIEAIFTPTNCLHFSAMYHVNPGVNNFPAVGSAQNNINGTPVDVETLMQYSTTRGIPKIVLWGNTPSVEVYIDTFGDQARYARAIRGYIDNAIKKGFAEQVTGSEFPGYLITEKRGDPPLLDDTSIPAVDRLRDGVAVIQGPSGRVGEGEGGETQYKVSGDLIRSVRVFLSDQISELITYAEVAGNAGGFSDVPSGPPGVTNKSNRFRGGGSLSPQDSAYNILRRTLGPGTRFKEGILDLTNLEIVTSTFTESLPVSTATTGTAYPIFQIPIESQHGNTIIDGEGFKFSGEGLDEKGLEELLYFDD